MALFAYGHACCGVWSRVLLYVGSHMKPCWLLTCFHMFLCAYYVFSCVFVCPHGLICLRSRVLSRVVTHVVVCWVTCSTVLVTNVYSHVLACLSRVLTCSSVLIMCFQVFLCLFLPMVTRVVICGHACCCMLAHMSWHVVC